MQAQEIEPLIYYCYKRWFFKSTIIQGKRPTSCGIAKEIAERGFADIGIWLPPKDSVNIYYIKQKRKVYVTTDNQNLDSLNYYATADHRNLDSFKEFPALYLQPRSNWAQLKQVLKNYGPHDPPKHKPDPGRGTIQGGQPGGAATTPSTPTIAEEQQRLVLSIIDFLNQSIEHGMVNVNDKDRLEVTIQRIGEVFGVDPSDEQQVSHLTVKPVTLPTIFDAFLETGENVGQSTSAAAASSSASLGGEGMPDIVSSMQSPQMMANAGLASF